MDELDKGLAISLNRKAREAALRLFRGQITKWQIAMPLVEPLVLDFGLRNFAEIGLIEYWIANETKAGYCGKYLFVFDGQTCPMHRHKTKQETFFIVKGSVHMHYDDNERKMTEGRVLTVEPWKYHSFKGIGPALLLEISMPCAINDNYFKDTRIPIGGNYTPASARGSSRYK